MYSQYKVQLIVFNHLHNYMSCNYFYRWLTLENNNISSVPDNFENLSALIHLNLSHNRINLIPVSFTKLKKLQYLFMKSNDFFTLDIFVLKKMGHLQKIDLSDNPIVASRKTLEVCKVVANWRSACLSIVSFCRVSITWWHQVRCTIHHLR